MATEIRQTTSSAGLQNRSMAHTAEQKEAWLWAKWLLHKQSSLDSDALSGPSKRALHTAMSELRAEQGRSHRGPIETVSDRPDKAIEYKAILIRDQIAARTAEWKQYLRDPGSKKLFIILRPDLTPAQKAVQASHCAAQFQKQHPHAPWVNGTMVLLEPNQQDRYWSRWAESATFGKKLDQFESYARHKAMQAHYKTFWSEPDMEDKLTAFALLSDYRNQEISRGGDVRLI